MAKALQLSKRVQVDKAQALMLAIVVGASLITVFSLVASRAFFAQARYLDRVATKKEAAVKQLKANKAAVSTLVTSYKAFAEQNPNLIGGNTDGTAERDGDNARLVLDALPSKYDFPALATSLEKLLTGYAINEISGSDESAAQDQASGIATTDTTTEAVTPEIVDTVPGGAGSVTLVEMPFTIAATSDYAGIQRMFTTFEKSIRPFQVKSIELTGTNAKLKAVVTAQTFYQPEKDLTITTEDVK